MPYTPILATLGYVFSPDNAKVLMIHRNKRPDDPHFGKYNGLGGKLERNEDIITGLRREIREEAGIECLDLDLAGTISWPGFGKNGEDWFGFVFRIDRFSGVPIRSNLEGDLEWISKEELLDLPLWEGDRYFLPLVIKKLTFHGVMPYLNGRPESWSYQSINVEIPDASKLPGFIS